MFIASIPFPDIDPVIVRLGPLSVRWYGIAYLLGFLAAYFALRALANRKTLRVPPGAVSDFVSWVALGVVVGGRAGWWLFYHRADMITEPWWEPLAIWHGGMSFHGGLIGVAVATFFWSRRYQATFWNVADALALVAPIGLMFGRLANFINAELVGRPTHVPWGIVFPGDTVARHPSQLYEAVLEGPCLLALLWLTRPWSARRDGRAAALLLVGYAAFRFAVEFTREPDVQVGFIAFGWLTMGQALSVALGIVGVVLARGLPKPEGDRRNGMDPREQQENPKSLRPLDRPTA